MRGKKDGTAFPFPFFPLIIFILLCFKVLSTVPRENRLAEFLYIGTGIAKVMGSNPVRARIFFRSYLQLLVAVVFLAARIS